MLDIVFRSPTSRACSGATRRDFLRVGSLGALGLAGLLRAEAEARPARDSGARARSVILVYLGGGLSHIDTFDPKPDAPDDIRSQYQPIRTAVPGLQLCERLPLMAKMMDRLTLVRSGSHTSDHHETAANWVLSGRSGSPFGDYPAIGAVVAHEAGFSGTLPAHVAVPRNPSFTWELGKSAFLGERYESFPAGDPNRNTLRNAVDGLAKRAERTGMIATSDKFQVRAEQMVLSAEARRAFAVDEEPESLRDRYGRTTAGQSMLLARRLVEAGVRFVTVNYAGWDHHTRIFDSLDRKLPEFDQSLSALIEDMHTRGTFDETLLLVMSEFGRTPRINTAAGRDHWGPAGSLLFAGAGVKRGFVLGEPDRHGTHPTERPVGPADVAHTVLDALGIDPRKQLRTPDGRPIPILDRGTAITELFE